MGVAVMDSAQMACVHVLEPLANGPSGQLVTCQLCSTVLRWWGSYTATIKAEWITYRPEGFDLEEWGTLFTKDRSLWPFLIEAAKEELQ